MADQEAKAAEGGEVTRLLGLWREGDRAALDRLIPIVYSELRRVAQRQMSGEEGSTLEATALVNEVYLRLVGMDLGWTGRVHFFAVAAGLMRRILVDRARRRLTRKRGGRAVNLDLDLLPAASRPAEDLLALDRALADLAAEDARKAKVLELRLFAEMSIEETAAALAISTATVERDLRLARAFVASRLKGPS